MRFKAWTIGLVAAAAIAGSAVDRPAVAQEDGVFIPLLVYRTGPFAPSGIPLANGFVDYFKLVNSKGGVNGTKIIYEECETQYDTKQGVECYEKMKGAHGGAVIVNPYSTGITYAVIPKAATDKVVIHSMGYGRADSSVGSVFPWVFTMPTTYWSQASAFIKYIGEKEGGLDKLKGKKIALVYLNSAYGKEPIPTLEELAKRHGYEFTALAVEAPGQEQKSTWLQIRRLKPDWLLMWGWGVMNQVAVKEAADIGYPMDHFLGVWWSGSDADVRPAGDAAKGYTAGAFHAPGANFALHKEILQKLYNGNEQAARANGWGEVMYNRGIVNAMFNVEAVRIANEHFKTKKPNAEQVRWAFENFKLSAERLKELGLEDFTQPIQLTCEDHEGGGPVRIQQWDGKEWKFVSNWIQPMKEVVRPLMEASAKEYAQQNNVPARDCSKQQAAVQ